MRSDASDVRATSRSSLALALAFGIVSTTARPAAGTIAGHAAAADSAHAAPSISASDATPPLPVAREIELSPASRRLVEITAARADDVAWIEAELASLGSDAVATLVDVGAEGTVRIPRRDRPALALPLSAALVRALPGALARSPSSVVARADPSDEARLFALEVLARSGTARDLELAQRLAGDGTVPSLADAFERAVANVLARSPASSARLGLLHAALAPALKHALGRALTELPTFQSLPLLAHLVEARRGDEATLLAAIARLGRASDACDTEDVRSKLRILILDSDARVAAAAARAVGTLGDIESVPEIASMLGSFERSARESAHTSLVALAGVDLGPDAAAWHSWHAREASWWQVEGAAAETDLASGDAVAAARAIRELVRHGASSHGAARILESGLARPEPEIASLACAALGQIRCENARLALEDALDHADPSVRETARSALALRRERGLDRFGGADGAASNAR